MARYPLYVHRDVQTWLAEHPTLVRRADWLLAELAARGVAGRPKGVAGPAREVVGLPGHRWRRSGLGGFDYYAWWFEAGESHAFPAGSRVVRAVRHHDLMDVLTVDDPDGYVSCSFEDLQPLSDEQAAVARAGSRVRLAVGHPGTGKTGALLYAVLEEARLTPDTRLLYVTLSHGLAEDARLFLEGLPELRERVEVCTYENLLREWSTNRAPGISDRAEESAFLGFLAEQPRNELSPWQHARGALWAEVRAHLIGRALPFSFDARCQPASEQPFLDRKTYLSQRQRDLGIIAANKAWRLAERFVEGRPPASLHRQAWETLQRIRDGRLDSRLRRFHGLVVDEIQDLTLLQLSVLVEATRRIGEMGQASPCFVAAGDESQVVHPSGFDWGVCKDLLHERLGTRPEEFQLVTNQRSPSPLVEASNRTAALYDELPKEHRPQARVEAEKTEACNGRVYVCSVEQDDPNLAAWLELLPELPGSAVVVCPQVEPAQLAPLLAEERFADLLYEPAVVKGLDRQYVVVWEASRVLGSLRDDVRAARNQGDRPRYLAARRAIDEFRVAVSRSNETLVFLDRTGAERDPLLSALVNGGPAEEVSTSHLRYVLETREHDPLERTQELFKEASDLLDVDLHRALRSLERADGALETLRDPEARAQAHERRIETRRRTAGRLLHAANVVEMEKSSQVPIEERYCQVAEQLSAMAHSYQELERPVWAELMAIQAERFREIPPGAAHTEDDLPMILERYVLKLAELPDHERASAVHVAREWRDELRALEWHVPDHLRQCLVASQHLTELTASDDDAQSAAELRASLVTLLMDNQIWAEALEVLAGLSDAPAAQLARCYEGLGMWEAAAECREGNGDLSGALANYRQAGNLEQAAALAERLELGELARALRVAATLVSQLDTVGTVLEANLSEPELRRLVDSLHRAAEKLAPRHRRVTERRRR